MSDDEKTSSVYIGLHALGLDLYDCGIAAVCDGL